MSAAPKLPLDATIGDCRSPLERVAETRLSAAERLELRRALRLSAASVEDAEGRAVVGASVVLALLAHVAGAVLIGSMPSYESMPFEGANQMASERTVSVAIIPAPQPKKKPPEKKEEPRVELTFEPLERPELVELERLELAVVEPPPKPKQKRRKRKVRKAAKPAVAKAGAPVAKPAVKPLTTPDAATPGGGEVPGGPVLADAVKAAEPGGQPDGHADGTADKGDPRTEVEEPGVDLFALQKRYIKRVSRHIKRKFRYPRAAKRAGLEGTVVIKVTIDGTGRVVAKTVLKSSGFPILDKAALRAVGSVGDLPTPPQELKWTQRTMTLPFDYYLRNG